MNFNLILIAILCFESLSFSQKKFDTIVKENLESRAALNLHYSDSLTSPLSQVDRMAFDSFPFFPIDTNYYVIAKFERAKNTQPFKMKTSSSRTPVYEVYGTVTFSLFDTNYTLNIYQNHRLRDMEKYKNHLFLPFNDFTNGNETYGGGRYLDLTIPNDSTIVIDFNKAYNPYCAYSLGYSCPVPPVENSLKTKINAGIKYEEEEH